MIGKDLATITKKEMLLQFQCKLNRIKFKAMDWVVLLERYPRIHNRLERFQFSQEEKCLRVQGINLCFGISNKMSLLAYYLTRMMQ